MSSDFFHETKTQEYYEVFSLLLPFFFFHFYHPIFHVGVLTVKSLLYQYAVLLPNFFLWEKKTKTKTNNLVQRLWLDF